MADLPANPPARKFNLLDGLILIAALAIGLGLVRAAESARPWPKTRQPLPASYRLIRNLESIHGAAVVCVAMLSVAMFLLRLRRPRPRLFNVLKQPGAIACYGPVLMLVVGLLALPEGATRLSEFARSLEFVGSFYGAIAVIGGWGWLWALNEWKPEPSGIDRLGRALGLAWIVLPMLLCAIYSA